MLTGIEFNGKHSLRDFGLTVSNRKIGYPSKIKRQERVPFSNTIYDFSNLYGGQEYEERSITYTLNLINKSSSGYRENFQNNQLLETKVVNWLMGANQKAILKDDTIDGYYFMAELVDGPNSEFRFVGSELTIEFIAYPFKISELQEGHDIWDEFNFELDVAQPVSYKMDGEYTFKELPIGSTATIGAWATTYASGGGKIPIRNIGISGTITGMEYVASSRSKRAYNVTGIDGLVVEQDIIQAHTNPLKVTLINAGTPSVTTKLDLTAKATIVKGNRSYNFVEGGLYKNEDFRLDSGENKLTIYSFHENEIKFNFHKELI